MQFRYYNSSDSLYDSSYSYDTSYSTTYNEESSNSSSVGILSTYDDTSSDTAVSSGTYSEYEQSQNSSNHSHKTDNASPKSEQDKKSTVVYITITGEKSPFRLQILKEISLKETKAEGYNTPCSVCCPPQ